MTVVVAARKLDEAALLRFGRALAGLLRVGDVIALAGDLGAGKTTLARGILEGLGLQEEAPSPTFALIQPYEAPPLRLPVWHVDLYRLDGEADACNLGLEEGFETALCLIEWPERLGRLLPGEALTLRLGGAGDHRLLEAHGIAAWQERLAGLEPQP